MRIVKVKASVKKDEIREVTLKTEYIKLDSLLKLAEIVGSGGEAKTLIQDGAIRVNGEVCDMRGKKIHPGDEVRFSNILVKIN